MPFTKKTCKSFEMLEINLPLHHIILLLSALLNLARVSANQIADRNFLKDLITYARDSCASPEKPDILSDEKLRNILKNPDGLNRVYLSDFTSNNYENLDIKTALGSAEFPTVHIILCKNGQVYFSNPGLSSDSSYPCALQAHWETPRWSHIGCSGIDRQPTIYFFNNQTFFGFPLSNLANSLCDFDGNLCEHSPAQAFKNVVDGLQHVSNFAMRTITISCKSLVPIILVAIQSFTITICLFLGMFVFRMRRTRVIKAANWILLEIFLLGAICLYCTFVWQTIVMYMRASDATCFLRPWMREIGFSVMYGVLFVKVYRVLSTFQSRKAHRVHVREKDLLKYLGVIGLLSIAFMTTWTCTNLDFIQISPWSPYKDKNFNLTMMVKTPNKEFFSLDDPSCLPEDQLVSLCRALSWDVVAEICEFCSLYLSLSTVEMIVLAVCIKYCKMVRSAPSEHNEIYFITIALINELLLSALLHVSR
ncbi:hypothetical protein Ciccas_001298 [Cichlidogyrus casuarinus]|uniref:G-protein coupled receptors family 3 profile domain-containing protein n=1 Tax=Cichlidogyrus casuarinus TaxID=1844966 RepID=A0ABD2QKI3_9PLAT